MSVDLVRTVPPRRYPLVDPDLSVGGQYGYRDPYRIAKVRVTYGPPAVRKPKRSKGMP